MADGTNQTVVLLAIHPRYAEALMAGTKQVEFRKIPFRSEPTHVVVYATRPICAVIGVLAVNGVEIRAPSTLWKKFHAVAGIGRADFFQYYAEATRGVAVRIGAATRLASPIPLADLQDRLSAPQSFRYLEASILARFRDETAPHRKEREPR